VRNLGYLLNRAMEYKATYPTPATPKQRAFLKWRGCWRDGLTKRQACRLIGGLKAISA